VDETREAMKRCRCLGVSRAGLPRSVLAAQCEGVRVPLFVFVHVGNGLSSTLKWGRVDRVESTGSNVRGCRCGSTTNEAFESLAGSSVFAIGDSKEVQGGKRH